MVLNGTSLQSITGLGAYARLTLNNPAGAAVVDNITLQEDLTLTQGILDIKKNLVTLGVNSNIQGAPFSASKMITSDGVFSNVGLRKFFNPGASSFLYPIGTTGKYTPALLTVTASNTVGYVRINNINSRHPAILDPQMLWHIIGKFRVQVLLDFQEAWCLIIYREMLWVMKLIIWQQDYWFLELHGAKHLEWLRIANTITFNYITSNNLSGEYTAGTTAAFPGNVPVYTSNSDGNWTNQAIWTQTGGDPLPCSTWRTKRFYCNH